MTAKTLVSVKLSNGDEVDAWRWINENGDQVTEYVNPILDISVEVTPPPPK